MNKMVPELEGMCEAQRKKLLQIAARIIPNISAEDLLQPQDYPDLELHPEFRYEEGILAGLETALAMVYACESEANNFL
jgi:hypothetical protein